MSAHCAVSWTVNGACWCRRCGLGSAGTDTLVELVRAEQGAALARGQHPALYGAKITGGGSGGELLP